MQLRSPPLRGRETPRVRHPSPARQSREFPAASRPGACACGGGCPRCVTGAGPVPPTVSGDELERQAELFGAGAAAGGAEAPLGSRPGGRHVAPPNPLVSAIVLAGVESSPAEPLPPEIRDRLEPRAGADLSAIRVHRGATAAAAARAVGAHGYTAGNHIVLGDGARDSGTVRGARTLAHEVAHVGQQTGFAAASARGVQFSLQSYIEAMQKKPEPDWATAAEHLNGEKPTTIRSILKNLSVKYRARLHEAARTWPGLCSNIARLTEDDYRKLHPEDTRRANDECQRRPDAGTAAPPAPAKAAEATGERLMYFEFEDLPNGHTVLRNVAPPAHADFIEKRLTGVGFGIYLGGYLLYVEGLDKPVFLPDSHVDFLLTSASVASDVVYDTRDLALKAESDAPRLEEAPRRVAYYRGAGGALVVPTVFSPATTPRAIATMLEARRKLAQYVQEEMATLAISMVGGAVLRKAIGWAQRIGTGPVKTPQQLLKEWGVSPKPGAGKAPAPRFDDLDLPALRQAAKADPEAAEALRLRYRDLSDAELRGLARKGDGMAQHVLDSRVPPNTPLQRLQKGHGRFSEPSMQDTLAKDVAAARAKGGIPRRGRSAVAPDAPVEGGTVAAARTDVPGLDKEPIIGRSPAAGGKVNPKSEFAPQTDPTKLPQTHGHAEQDVADQLAAKLRGKSPDELRGRKVYVLVEQEPCPTCAQGLASADELPGVLRKLSEKFPDLTFEVKNMNSSSVFRIKGGKAVE